MIHKVTGDYVGYDWWDMITGAFGNAICFPKDSKIENLEIVYECLIASVLIVGLFASGQIEEHNNKDGGLQV